MKRADRAFLMLLFGLLALQLVRTGGFGWFVQQRMRWPLLAAGSIAALIGLIGLMGRAPDGRDADHDDGDHHHGTAGRAVVWLLLVPVAVMLAVAPTALGSDAARRAGIYQPTSRLELFDPLPAGSEPLELTMSEFITRALWDPDASLTGRDVRLEGFITNDPRPGTGVVLTRFAISCCAADALPLQVALRTDRQLADDTWVRVVVRWVPAPTAAAGSDDLVEAHVAAIEIVPDVPDNPYESPY